MLISAIMYRTLFVVNIKNKFLRYNLKLISTAFELKSSIKLAYIMSRLDWNYYPLNFFHQETIILDPPSLMIVSDFREKIFNSL